MVFRLIAVADIKIVQSKMSTSYHEIFNSFDTNQPKSSLRIVHRLTVLISTNRNEVTKTLQTFPSK